MINQQDLLYDLRRLFERLCETGEPKHYREIVTESIAFIKQQPLDVKRPTDDAPTYDECVAAMNRNRHRGSSRWKLGAFCDYSSFEADETIAIGKMLIEKEKGRP